MPGLNVTKEEINLVTGDVSKAIILNFRRAMNVKAFLDRFTSQNLVDEFGFTIGEANTIKSAFGQISTINTSLQGNRTFIDQVTGLGDV